MIFVCIALAAALLLSLAERWRCERQLREWAAQLTETDENSNLRLGASVRSRGFLRACRAINERLEKGRQARILQENAARELKDAIACISHDIRTPLTGASGYLQLLEKENEPERRKAYLDIICRRLSDLENILEELFLFTKLTNEGYHIECEEIDPFPVLCDVLAGFYGKLTEAGMEPELSFGQMKDLYGAEASGRVETAGTGGDTVDGVTVRASREALSRIFSNLIQNAIYYGSGGLRIGQEGERIYFSNPVDVAEKVDADRLFERFYRADGSRHSAGAGLGLASVKGLMEKMGGGVCAAVRDGELTISLLFERR